MFITISCSDHAGPVLQATKGAENRFPISGPPQCGTVRISMMMMVIVVILMVMVVDVGDDVDGNI